MIKIAEIYDSMDTSGSLLQHIKIQWWIKNSQHYILAHSEFHKISIDTFKWVIYEK